LLHLTALFDNINGRNMKHITKLLVVLFFLTACSPQPQATDLPAYTATISPTPLPTQTTLATLDPLANTLLYSDDFSDDQSGWEAADDNQSKFSYADGRYFIQAASSEQYYLMTSADTFGDGVLNVDVQQMSGDDQLTGGMVFWRYRDNDNFFALSISDAGTFSIHRYLDGVYDQAAHPRTGPQSARQTQSRHHCHS
jgi:hypothetical protein